MNLVERLIAIRTGGGVERCHTVLHQGSYSVAAHSWGVATLMLLLYPADFPRLAVYCLVHDVPEAWVGDIPATTKKYCPDVKSSCDRLEAAILERLLLPNDADLQEEDRQKLKACDLLDLYLWAKEQVMGGNLHADCVRREVEDFIRRVPLHMDAMPLYSKLQGTSVEHKTDGLIKELTVGW